MRSLILLVLPVAVWGSSCGPAAIPFSFEALPDGQPVLGCARPSCFGWTLEGKPAGPPSTFYRVNKKPDGYFRKNAETPKAGISLFPQTAKCSETFDAEQCSDEKKWVGGIGPLVNVSGLPIAMQCCEYEYLSLSTDRGVAVVNPGQVVIGGEVIRDGRQYAFDYVSDMTKRTKTDGSVVYEVSIRRLPCLPQPLATSANVEQTAIDEIVNRFEKKSRPAVAFQAPIRTVSEQLQLQEIGTQEQIVNTQPVAQNQPVGQGRIISQTDEVILQPTGQERVEVVQGPFVAEPDAIVEEVQAVQGLELPEGQVPQGLIEPQPAAPAYGGYGGYGGGYGGGGGGGATFCFSADTTVRLSDGQTKRMDELNVNDWILSANSTSTVFANVESWIHRMPKVKANFRHIQLSDGRDLKITSKHYIYKTECKNEGSSIPFEEINQKSVFAEKVAAGDCLYVLPEENDGRFVETKVIKVEEVEETGIYAPMTSNGDLLVNGIYSSCYNLLNSRVMQHSFVENVRSLPSIGSLFGEVDNDITDLPYGTSLIVELMEYVLPVSFLSV